MFFKSNPILRLLLPFAAGITIQWYMQVSTAAWIAVFLTSMTVYFITARAKAYQKLRLAPVQGLTLMIAVMTSGAFIALKNDVRKKGSWFASQYREGEWIAATIGEDLVVKERSYKANADISCLMENDKKYHTSGGIIIYFKKDSVNQQLRAGDQIIFNRPLREIQNTGNPGGFDYKRYCLFNGITHYVYLTGNDYKKLPGNQLPFYKQVLQKVRNYVLNAIKENINGKKEQGLAEAMLIGYKDDLDKTLLQSYTNTGVVHVIAVSGMHLALLYWIIHLLLKPLLKKRSTRWLHPVLVLLILWGFCFITGGAASIVRAAVMFTFITIGTHLNRNTPVYNLLSASAFFQLCYNPYWLWDVGFQLSYMAVLSIVIFYRPVYNLFFVKNKILDWVWQLAAVSIAAQILTTPVSMCYFHQFPVYFLLNNLVVVPVSTVVLMGTLLLVILSPIKALAAFIGYLLNGLIWWLNSFIEMMEDFPFALWTGIQMNVFQGWLFIMIIAGFSYWLIQKQKAGLWTGMTALLLFFGIRSYSFFKAQVQQKLIVYNANKHAAIDFISGRKYVFAGDPDLLQDQSLSNYVLAPSHTLYRVVPAENLVGLYLNGSAIQFGGKKIIVLDAPVRKNADSILYADLVVLSGNPKLYISGLNNAIRARQVVIDGSVPAWKARYWIKDCDSLKIPCHNVAEDGAFVMSLY